VPAAPIVTGPPASATAPMTLALLRRGEALLAGGDISAARSFFERAAAAGNANAARAMAETYDPRVLAGLGVRGLVPDRAAALEWYRRAAALGAPDAAARIAALEAEP
jgi:TPR repeat protein